MGAHSSVEKRLVDKPVVIVIGGGYAGVAVAQLLDEQVNVLLVERKTMFYHNVGALRASVEGDATQILIPYTNALKFGHVIQSEVTNIDTQNRTIQLHGHNQPVPFDYLVIATGTSYCFPMKVAVTDATEIASLIQKFSKDCKEAKNILIVGGGPVGCEIAGEIRHLYSDKSITLVHSGPELIPGPTVAAFKADVKKRLEGMRVTVLLADRLTIPDEARVEPLNPGAAADAEVPGPGLRYLSGKRTFTTSSGKKLEADLVVFATGALTNSNAYDDADGIPVNGEKRILVDEFLRVKGQERVFALGDCADIEAKLAFLAGNQAKVVASNILAHIAGKGPKPYKKMQQVVMLLPLGPNEGCSAFGGIVIGKTITRAVKGKTLFVDKYRTQLGVKESSTNVSETTEVDLTRLASRLRLSEAEAKELVDHAQPIKYGPDATHV